MRTVLSIVVLLAGLGGGAALYLNGQSALKVEAQSVADEVDSRLRETLAAIHSRASTLADLPIMESVVATDAPTARDLTAKELAFRTKPNEVIEIGQVLTDGKTVTLLRLPENGRPQIFSSPGIHVRIDDGKVMLDEVTNVRPAEHGESLRGALAVAWWADLSSVSTRLESLGLGAQLVAGSGSVALSTRAPAGGHTFDLPLGAVAGGGAHLLVQEQKVSPVPAAGVAGGGLLLAIVLLLLPRAKPAPTPSMVVGSAPTDLAVAPLVLPPRASESATAGKPTQIGRYTILRQLGSGGMAEVYLARVSGEAGFEKLVALKVLQKQLAMQPIVVEHFLDEAKLASRLTHPNIVQISDLGKAGDEYFIAMEFIDGADLGALLGAVVDRKGQVPVKVALAIVRRICDGLNAAHVAKNDDGRPLEIVHRDVKSANVFVARNGAVKLGDFGIAKANQVSRVNKTELGQVKGTAAYMAPEHRLGKVVDRRADIYAVGAIAYELLTGSEVNLDLAVLADLGRVGWPHLTPPSLVRTELPPELDAILWKAMAYERDDRYADAEQLEEALGALVERYGLAASDKVIAQWVESEMAGLAEGGPAHSPTPPSQQVS